MSVTKIHEKIVFVCDECQDDLETGETSWFHAREIFKKEGWRTIFEGSGFKHYCPDCT